MKIKEEILKEFDEKFADISEDRTVWNFKKDTSYGQVKYFLSQALTQTREETIREVEEDIKSKPSGYLLMSGEVYEDEINGYEKCRQEVIKILNKLKK